MEWLITQRNVAYFFISSMDLSFCNRCILTDVSDRIARAFNRSGATQTVLLDISKAFDRVWLLVFLTNRSLIKFQLRYLVLFLLFSVISSLGWFWMENLHKNIQLMLQFLKVLFLAIHFSYYFSTTFPILSCCDM